MTKLLKAVSIIMIVFSVIALILEVFSCLSIGITSLFGSLTETVSASNPDAGSLIGGIIFGIIADIIMLIAGVYGSKAAATGKVKPCFILGLIVCVFAVISIITIAAAGSFLWTTLLQLALPVLYILPVIKLVKADNSARR